MVEIKKVEDLLNWSGSGDPGGRGSARISPETPVRLPASASEKEGESKAIKLLNRGCKGVLRVIASAFGPPKEEDLREIQEKDTKDST
jgi:hypothetical protein